MSTLYTLENAEAYGYKLTTWQDFITADDKPDGLYSRALEVTDRRKQDRQFVIYDPEGDDEGWMLIGDRDEIIRETVDDLIGMEPPEGPLSPEALKS